MATTGERIKEAMILRGLKQADIVERTGINKGALSSYISGRYVPKQKNIYLLAKALDVNEAWLMGADYVTMDRLSDAFRAAQRADSSNVHSYRIHNDSEMRIVYAFRSLSTDGKGIAIELIEELLDAEQINDSASASKSQTSINIYYALQMLSDAGKTQVEDFANSVLKVENMQKQVQEPQLLAAHKIENTGMTDEELAKADADDLELLRKFHDMDTKTE